MGHTKVMRTCTGQNHARCIVLLLVLQCTCVMMRGIGTKISSSDGNMQSSSTLLKEFLTDWVIPRAVSARYHAPSQIMPLRSWENEEELESQPDEINEENHRLFHPLYQHPVRGRRSEQVGSFKNQLKKAV